VQETYLVKEDMESGFRSAIERWSSLKDTYDWQRMLRPQEQYHVLMDNQQRVIERVDRPRVEGIPMLKYAPPRAAAKNWTLFDHETARRAVAELDAKQVAFAPHRAVAFADLIDQRIAAAQHGLRHITEMAARAEHDGDNESPMFRP
jgi:hypothetical protein